jgi:hypothetical protein
MGLLDRIQAKLELFRLEQRYTRRRHRRSTFVSNAIYVDGEYIYNSPNTTGSSGSTSMSAATRDTTPAPSPTATTSSEASKQQKRLNRWSSMPGFGSNSKPDGMGGMPTVREQGERRARSSFDERRVY